LQDPDISVLNLLYAQWGAAGVVNPTVDPATLTTSKPTFIYMTNRYWATQPERIHSFQVSVMMGDEPNELIGIGSVLKYRFRPIVPVHLFMVTGTQFTIEQALPLMRNMQDEVSRIIKANPTGATDLQIIRLLTGWRNLDQLERENYMLHRVLLSTGIYYKT
jgi:hypothetical protein